MIKSRLLRKILYPQAEDTGQVNLIYILSLVVGLLSALAAVILKNAIHYTHQILTGGIPGAWNLPVLDNGYYVGFISKSRIYTTYRELLVQFSDE